ncbi:conserved hypothetical protein [Candidatus Roizmanbacteria bacterium]|nr:conserved hypothetical protein [Candidatus Roizmanbacteria bacterium]
MNIKNYRSREEEIRETLSLEQVIKIIMTKYPLAEYDPNNPNFDAWNQLLACEAVAESHPINKDKNINANANANGMTNDSSKQTVIFELTHSKQVIITKLNKSNYRTSPIEIAFLLEELFKEFNSKSGHWLFIAQNWTPRALNRTLKYLFRIQLTGQQNIQNFAGYFTYLLKFRKKRKNQYKYQ